MSFIIDFDKYFNFRYDEFNIKLFIYELTLRI